MLQVGGFILRKHFKYTTSEFSGVTNYFAYARPGLMVMFEIMINLQINLRHKYFIFDPTDTFYFFFGDCGIKNNTFCCVGFYVLHNVSYIIYQ